MRIIAFIVLIAASASTLAAPGDFDSDGDRDLNDVRAVVACLHGPGVDAASECASADFAFDAHVDLRDFALLQNNYSPWVRIVSTSPGNGDNGVALTRETIINLSGVINGTTVSAENLFAVFGGAKLAARLAPTPDGKRLKLFYQPTLPASARVRVTLDGSTILDELGYPIDADGDGVPGGVLTFDFDTCSIGRIPNTNVEGYVVASEPQPNCTPPPNEPPGLPGLCDMRLEGVTVRVDGFPPETGPCNPSNASHFCAVTDATGHFILQNTPAPAFFVQVDGSTVTRVGGQSPSTLCSYPRVGKPFHSVAGLTTHLIMDGVRFEVHLPCVANDSLQPVDPSKETHVCMAPTGQVAFKRMFPESDPSQLCITVPANSLTFDDGSPGHMIGMFPVDSNRLPAPLGAGMVHAFDITIQTDGAANFDVPAPICFPNVPDPSTHELPQPGEKLELVSFNHDTGRWEPRGPMTVIDDNDDGIGDRVCTDPGVGVIAPGWHGQSPPPLRPTPCPDCCPRSGAPGTPPFSLDTAFNAASTRCDCQPSPFCVPVCFAESALQQAEWTHATIIWAELCEAALVVNPALGAACLVGLGIAVIACEVDSALQLAKCLQHCNCSPANRTTAHEETPGSDIDPIADQIAQTLQHFFEEVTPRIIDGTIAPEELPTRLAQVLQEVNDIAGGDATRYLNGLVLQKATSLASLESTVGPDGGNAPSYPVYFMAVIGRANGDIIPLRGRTDPFGQYSLFVPRDGALLTVSFYDPVTQTIGSASPKPIGNLNEITRFTLVSITADFPDSDGDGLCDAAEVIIGTEIGNPDSDHDGIPDGAEVQQGTDPLDGRPAATGIIATADTPGTAVDVCAVNDIAIVADADRGVTVFNVTNGQAPVAITQVDTPGTVRAVACSGNLIAAADGTAGLAIIDVTDPPAARIIHQISSQALGGGNAQAVAAFGDLAAVGTTTGYVSLVELSTGVVLSQLSLGVTVQDLAVDGDYLYAYVTGQLRSLRVNQGVLQAVGSVNSPGNINSYMVRGRLFVGGGIAYAVHERGYNTINVSDPAHMILVAQGNTGQIGWKQMAVTPARFTGSTTETLMGLAAVGVNPPYDPATHNVYLFDVSDPQTTNAFLYQFLTPGVARAVSIYNGLAYVADHDRGLQVINYLAYDSQGVPPTITISTSSTDGTWEEGQPFRLTANATDDVQVRNVEFYVDGMRVATDGNFPFEHRFFAPRLDRQPSFTVKAIATDTGGNRAESETVTIALTEDATPPRVVAFAPKPEDTPQPNTVTTLKAIFSEPIDPASIVFQLFTPGPDGILTTDDDTPVTGTQLTYVDAGNTVLLTVPTPLPAKVYHAVVSSYTDMAGNAGPEFPWFFSTRTQQKNFSGNATIACTDMTWEGYDIIVSGTTLTVNCSHTFNSVSILNSGLLTHTAGQQNGLQLNVTHYLNVQSSARISADGRGFSANAGPGAGGSACSGGGCVFTGAGGGYGGTGGAGYTSPGFGATYGTASDPTELGSGGGRGWTDLGGFGGAGGGAVTVEVSGRVQVDGQLTANGNNGGQACLFGAYGGGGGGSGGSIKLVANSLSGSGLISANGGTGGSCNGGGGGGGRIAVYYDGNAFTGSMSAHGGTGYIAGGAGSIYAKNSSAELAELVFDNAGVTGGSTEMTGSFVIDANMRVRGNANVTHPIRPSGQNSDQLLHLQVQGDLVIEPNGLLSVAGRGFSANAGPGAGGSACSGGGCVFTGAGGGYGGTGGAGYTSPGFGATYGTASDPTELGSGGGRGWTDLGGFGGAGGGAVTVEVSGRVQVDGQLTANGNNGGQACLFGAYGGGGGGSGGSIKLVANSLSGSGLISANGGTGGSCNGGGGGGGRIAVYICQNNFPGANIRVNGGSGFQNGSAGTVHSAQPNPANNDCNNNGVADICDIAFGTSEDANRNGIPDECE